MTAPYQGYAAVYDRTGQSRFSLRMVAYARQLWELADHPVRSVLELACGTGSAAVALANRGVRVVAVDRSEAMLAQARVKARRWKANVDFRRQDLRELAVSGTFDAATCFYDSLNYLLVPTELEAVFEKVHAHLVPGGLFLFDAISDHGIAEGWGDSLEAHSDEQGARIWRSRYDSQRKVGSLEIEHFVRQEGTDTYLRVRETHEHRGYSPFEVRAALEEAGFDFLNAYRALSFEPVGPTTYRIAYLARRSGA